MRSGINETGLVLKIPLITAHEWETGINDTVTNDHKNGINCKLTLLISHRLSLSNMISMTKTQNMTVTFAAAASGRNWLPFFYFFVK
jgi:hypothetical protein